MPGDTSDGVGGTYVPIKPTLYRQSTRKLLSRDDHKIILVFHHIFREYGQPMRRSLQLDSRFSFKLKI